MIKSFSFYVALLGIVLAILLSNILNKPEPELQIVLPSPKAPYQHFIQASGIIQSFDKNVFLGPNSEGVVDQVYVKVGDKVSQGDPLFKLDSSTLEAQLIVQKANQEIGQTEFLKQKSRFDLLNAVGDPKAISQDELLEAENTLRVAEAKWAKTKSEVAETGILISRQTRRSPQDGTILQLNIRPGEYVRMNEQAIVLGNLSHYQILVSIDEQNAIHFKETSRAVAFPKNNSVIAIPLKFYRIEPFVVPKTSLTGLSQERIDTRVLHVIYTVESENQYPLYVGQQMDVFIETAE